jgi:NDP-sugar pyrophosphorylase family protein
VNIGAILTIAGDGGAAGEISSPGARQPVLGGSSQLLLGCATAFSELLGQRLLDRVIQRLRASGVERVSVISEKSRSKISQIDELVYAGGGFWSAWDSVVSQSLTNGIETLLLTRLGPYVEVEVPDLIRFHQANSNPLTQVYDEKGPLDFVLVNAAELNGADGSFRSRLSSFIPHRNRYRFSGYSNRLSAPADFRRLVHDAFLGRCAIRPTGREVRPGVWMGDYSFIDNSARIDAPAYIGAGTRIGASCNIGGSSAIERNCEIDCGTIVEDCCILPGTYVGMGLNVRHSLVSGSKLFHLKRNIEMEFKDRSLIANTLASRNNITGATSRLLRPMRVGTGSGLAARFSKVASLVSNRWGVKPLS